MTDQTMHVNKWIIIKARSGAERHLSRPATNREYYCYN